jgi:predicted aminopeptidase
LFVERLFRARTIAVLSAASVLFLFVGCGTTAYYGQAVSGQMEIWRKQVPVEEVAHLGVDDAEVQRKLALIQDLRIYAENVLGLPAGNDYTKYADLGREHVVWNVFAAPEFSFEPQTFWYPVVGTLEYRGFFKETEAEVLAADLRLKGLDVFVGGVDAYSTLGWFADPVLNTFMRYDDIDLAELVFHELTHQRLFIYGETAFNEAMATAVAEEGTRRWLASLGETDGPEEYERRLDRQMEVFREIKVVRAELGEIYGSDLPDERKREAKTTALKDLQRRLLALSESWGPKARATWLEQLPNNALLNATATYYAHVPRFSAMIRDVDGDLDRFFAEVKALDVASFLGEDGNG